MIICRFQPKDLLLDGNIVTTYRSKDSNIIRLTDPHDILNLNSENTVFDEKDCIHIILQVPQPQPSLGQAKGFLEECMKHLLTELRVKSLLIQPERSDCELPHAMTQEFLLRSLKEGYVVESIGNVMRFTT